MWFVLVVLVLAIGPAQAEQKSREPYSCRLLDDEQRKCGFGNCDHRVVERLRRECLRDGGTVR